MDTTRPFDRTHGATAHQRASVRDDVARAYGALRTGAMLVDLSSRVRATFAGAKAAEVLTGLLTNDVLALSPGQGQYAAALTSKGKVIADLRLFARSSDFLADVSSRAAEGWWTLVRKYVNPRLAKYADVSAELSDIGVYGARAASIVSSATGIDSASLADLGSYGHRETTADGARLLVARVPDLGVDGYEIFAAPDVVARTEARLLDLGAESGGPAAFTIARIEAGRPEWGIDMDDTTLAQEANLDTLHAISYTKGCYTGQETVARVHFRGHVNRSIRGLAINGPELPPRGSELLDESGRVLGDVRSAAMSPRLGGVALAMVRREVQDGKTLNARHGDSVVQVTVVALPFPP